MRVLILRHGYLPEDPRVRREARALLGRGHQVDAICLRRPGQAGREVVDGMRLRRVPLGHRRSGTARYAAEYSAFFLAAAALATFEHVRRPFDIVQVNTMPDALVFAAAAPKLLGARVVLDLHEVMPELYVSKFGGSTLDAVPRGLAWLEQRSIRFADAALAVSDPCLSRFAERGAPRSRLHVVMNSADPAMFRPRLGPPPPATRLRVVSHGTLARRYGFELLVEAALRVPEMELDIVGDGEMRAPLEAMVAAHRLGTRVRFSGRIPLEQVAARIAAADVGAVANISDPFTELVVPTKLMEYVALGVPAVAPRTKAVETYFSPPLVELFRPGDTEDLARALRRAGADAGDAVKEAARAAARQAFEDRFGWPAMAERYVELLERIAVGPIRRG